MEVVTLACPENLTNPALDLDTAPVWKDAAGVAYRVASGLLQGYVQTEPAQAQPDRLNVIIGMSGLDALAAMGLTRDAPQD